MNITVYGEDELINRIKNNGIVYRNVISIADPGSKIPTELLNGDFNVLSLRFLDIEEPFINHDFKLEIMPEKKHIKKVINFYNRIPLPKEITVHCWQGISRSTAIAMCLLYLYHMDENKVEEELRIIRAYARPNLKILREFDSIKKCNLEKIGLKIKMENIRKSYENYKDKDKIENVEEL